MEFSFEATAAIFRHLNDPVFREAERGGLLLGGSATVLEAVPLDNHAPNPREAFLPDPEEMDLYLQIAEHREQLLVGTFHSHPNGNWDMSPADVLSAENTGLLLIITTQPGNDWWWKLYDPESGGEVPFSIRPPGL